MPEKSLVTGHMNPDPCSLTAIFTCVRLQIDRFEDGGWVVVLPYPDGGRNLDVPREFCLGETGWPGRTGGCSMGSRGAAGEL